MAYTQFSTLGAISLLVQSPHPLETKATHGGNSCLTLGELAITFDTPITMAQPEQGLTMSREERDGTRETKPHTQWPELACPLGLAEERGQLFPHRPGNRKKE